MKQRFILLLSAAFLAGGHALAMVPSEVPGTVQAQKKLSVYTISLAGKVRIEGLVLEREHVRDKGIITSDKKVISNLMRELFERLATNKDNPDDFGIVYNNSNGQYKLVLPYDNSEEMLSFNNSLIIDRAFNYLNMERAKEGQDFIKEATICLYAQTNQKDDKGNFISIGRKDKSGKILPFRYKYVWEGSENHEEEDSSTALSTDVRTTTTSTTTTTTSTAARCTSTTSSSIQSSQQNQEELPKDLITRAGKALGHYALNRAYAGLTSLAQFTARHARGAWERSRGARQWTVQMFREASDFVDQNTGGSVTYATGFFSSVPASTTPASTSTSTSSTSSATSASITPASTPESAGS